MSEDPITALERELVNAARRRTGQPGPGRRPTAGRMLAGLGTGLVVAVTLALAAGALILLGGSGHQRPAPSGVVSGRQQLVDILGVLRRPQTNADLHSRAIAGLLTRYQQGSATPPLALRGTPDIPLVRRASVTPWGSAVFLIPMKPATAQSIAAASHQYPQLAARFLQRPPDFSLEGINLFVDGGGACCSTAEAVEAGAAMSMDGAGRSFAGGSTKTRFILLVPDGVAKVEFYFPSQMMPAGGPTYRNSLAVTVPVDGNIAAVEVNRECCASQPAMTWYAPDGTIIKRIGTTSPPPLPRQPAPPTPLSRAAERNPGTPNRVWATPITGGPSSAFTVQFRLLLNDADYEFRGTGPTGVDCQSSLGDITGGGPNDIRGQIFSDTFRPRPGRHWCPGTYRVTVAAYDLGRAGALHHAPEPFGAATFTVHR